MTLKESGKVVIHPDPKMTVHTKLALIEHRQQQLPNYLAFPPKEIPEIRGNCTTLLSLLQLERERQTNSHVRQLSDEYSRRATPRSIQQGKSLAKDDEILLYNIGVMSMTDTTKRSGRTKNNGN